MVSLSILDVASNDLIAASVCTVFYMFRTSYVHHQEDYIVHVDLHGMFFMRLCKQSQPARLLA